jgi:hypothetical protein
MKRISLSSGKSAMVDDEDFDRLSGWKWCAYKIGKTWYAMRSENRVRLYIHRVIMKPKNGLCVDHIDGDGLNNQRCNLRSVTHAENLFNRTRLQKNNRSGVNGLSWYAKKEKWEAKRIYKGKAYRLGYFASKAAGKKALELFNP